MENKDTTGKALNPIVIPISFSTSTIASEPATSTKRKVTACSNVTATGSGSSEGGGDFTNGVQVYNVAGTYSFKIPDAVTRIKVELWGGGTAAPYNSLGGFTGASGGYSLDYFSVTAGTVYSVVVGKEVTYGNTADGSSSFGTLLAVKGGKIGNSGTGSIGGAGSGKWGIDGENGYNAIVSSVYEEGAGSHYSCDPVNGPPSPMGNYKWGSGQGTCGGTPISPQPGRAAISW